MSQRRPDELELRDLMTTRLVVLEPGDTLREAVDLLSARGISGAPVVQRGRVVGVISSSDIMTVQSSLPGFPNHQVHFSDDGTWEDPPTWYEGEDSDAAFFVEMWDEAGAEIDERDSEPGLSERDVLAEHTVEEAMTRRLHFLPPEAALRYAAEYMTKERIHRILVMDGDRLIGLVSASDVVRAVGSGGVPTNGHGARADVPLHPPLPAAEPTRPETHGGFLIGPTDGGEDVELSLSGL